MSLISTISKPKSRPPIITIFGDGGLGKTSFGATFPKPIFIRAEDGLEAIPEATRPDAFPIVTEAQDIYDQLQALIDENGAGYKTVVIDTITQLDIIFKQAVVDKHNKSNAKKVDSVNQALGGYGAGIEAVATMHARVRDLCGQLNDAGMCVVFLAHMDVKHIDLPDSEKFGRYVISMNDKSVHHYSNNLDLVGFLKLKTYVNEENKKARSFGERELVCHSTANNLSKNRYDIEEPLDIPKGENPLLTLIKSRQKTGE